MCIYKYMIACNQCPFNIAFSFNIHASSHSSKFEVERLDVAYKIRFIRRYGETCTRVKYDGKGGITKGSGIIKRLRNAST